MQGSTSRLSGLAFDKRADVFFILHLHLQCQSLEWDISEGVSLINSLPLQGSTECCVDGWDFINFRSITVTVLIKTYIVHKQQYVLSSSEYFSLQ